MLDISFKPNREADFILPECDAFREVHLYFAESLVYFPDEDALHNSITAGGTSFYYLLDYVNWVASLDEHTHMLREKQIFYARNFLANLAIEEALLEM